MNDWSEHWLNARDCVGAAEKMCVTRDWPAARRACREAARELGEMIDCLWDIEERALKAKYRKAGHEIELSHVDEAVQVVVVAE